MRLLITVLIFVFSLPLAAQDKKQERLDRRKEKLEQKLNDRAEKEIIWYGTKQLRLDGLGLMAEFPSLQLAYQYPLTKEIYTIEHEVGAIFNNGINDRIDQLFGVNTNHTFMYSESARYAFGVGVHGRFMTFEGDIEMCATGGSNGGCQYWRVYQDPIHLQRFAGYLRIRTNALTRGRIGFSTTLDFGRYFQKATNDEFKADDLVISEVGRDLFASTLEKENGVYFRFAGQFVYRF